MEPDDPVPELRTVVFDPAPPSLLDLELAEAVTAAELAVLVDHLRASQLNVEAWARRAASGDGLSTARRHELELVVEHGRRMIEWAQAELRRRDGDDGDHG